MVPYYLRGIGLCNYSVQWLLNMPGNVCCNQCSSIWMWKCCFSCWSPSYGNVGKVLFKFHVPTFSPGSCIVSPCNEFDSLRKIHLGFLDLQFEWIGSIFQWLSFIQCIRQQCLSHDHFLFNWFNYGSVVDPKWIIIIQLSVYSFF